MRLLGGLDHIVVQDMFLTRTGEMAHVVLPAAASWCEDEGTVTSSERRVQRVRKALDPPGQARPDLQILVELGKRLGVDLGSFVAGGMSPDWRFVLRVFGVHFVRLEPECPHVLLNATGNSGADPEMNTRIVAQTVRPNASSASRWMASWSQSPTATSVASAG